MILFNKALLSLWTFGFPFFLTLWHCVFATFVTQLLVRYPEIMPCIPAEWGLLQSAKEGKVTRSMLIYRLLPTSFFFAGGLALGNSAYKHLSVAYIQMLKSLNPICILLLAFLLGREKPSVIQLSLVGIICGGVVLASAGELHFSAIGFFLQVSAILLDVCRMTLVDILMVDVKLDSLSMLYYLAPMSSVFILVGFLCFEYDPATFPWARILDPTFGSALILNASVAFLLNIAVYVAVANSSSVIIGVSGMAKDMLLVASSVAFFASPITMQQIIGYSISIVGLSWYKEYKVDPARMTERVADTWNRTVQFAVFAAACCIGRRGPAWRRAENEDDGETAFMLSPVSPTDAKKIKETPV